MLDLKNIPILNEESILKRARLMCKYKLGVVCITDKNFKLKGIITDGDLRRNFKFSKTFINIYVEDQLNFPLKNQKLLNQKLNY